MVEPASEIKPGAEIEKPPEVVEKPPEVRIETEEDVKELGDKTIEDTEKGAEEIITSGKEMFEGANENIGLDSEAVQEVRTETGVESELQTIQEEIQELTLETQDKIKEVTGEKPVEEKPEEKPVEEKPEEKPEEEKPEEKEKAEEDSGEQIKKINEELEKSKARCWELNEKDPWELTEEEKEEYKTLSNRGKELAESKEKLRKEYEETVLKEALSVLVPEKKPEEEKEISPLIKEKMEVTEKKSRENITNFLKEFFKMADDGVLKEAGIGNAKEALEKLKEEAEKVRESVSITINVKDDTILDVLEADRFKSFLELPPEEQKKRNPGYAERRIRDEKIMGTNAKDTPEDPYTIYGAMASRNGFDETFGGASQWGEVFVTLKPSANERCVFFYGDSMDTSARHPEDIPNHLLNLEHATIAKAMDNIKRAAGGQIKAQTLYIEANILGGVKIDDVESINISNSVAKHKMETETSPIHKAAYKVEYEESKKCIKKIEEKYPQHANLIKEV